MTLSPEAVARLQDNGNLFVFCDHVDPVHWGCVRGAGHGGVHAFIQRHTRVDAPVLVGSDATLLADLTRLQGEVDGIDAVLARRPALADCKSRREQVEHACSTAGRATDQVIKLEREVERLMRLNAGLCKDHNHLLTDGSQWQARAEAAEREVEQWKCNNAENKLIAEENSSRADRAESALAAERQKAVQLREKVQLACEEREDGPDHKWKAGALFVLGVLDALAPVTPERTT